MGAKPTWLVVVALVAGCAAVGDPRAGPSQPAPVQAVERATPKATGSTFDAPSPTATATEVGERLPPTVTPIPEAPIRGRAGAASVWTGKELVVWGGYAHPEEEVGAKPMARFATSYDVVGLNDGAAYNPTTRRWRLIAPSILPPTGSGRGTWTGSERCSGRHSRG